LGGRSTSGKSGDKTEERRGGEDFWVVKLKADGTKEWDKTYGGSDQDFLQALELTPDGGYILGGYTWSNKSGDKSEPKKGYSDYWVVKLKADGSKEWDKTFGGKEGNTLTTLQTTHDGGYILGGNSDSRISGDKTQGTRGWNDYWIIKITADGSKVWDKRFGGTKDEDLQALQQTSDGGYILGGYSNSDAGGDKTENRKGTSPARYSPDYWIVKLDANGSKVWDKSYGGQKAEFFTALQPTREGGYILGGFSYPGASGDKSEPSRGEADYWLVKIKEDGTKIWDKAYGGNDQDYLYTLQQTLDGGYLLGGSSFSGISGEKTQPAKNGLEFDYWVVKVEDNPYCVPVSTRDCTFGIYINNFSFYPLVNNNSGYNEIKSSYINYPPFSYHTTTVKRGHSYPISLEAGFDNHHYFGIWID